MKANIRTPTNLLFMPFLVPLDSPRGQPLCWGRLSVCAALFLRPAPTLPGTWSEAGRHGYAGMLHPGALARAAGGVRQLFVADGPNRVDAAAGAQEESGRSQRHKCHEQGVFDQVLPLFVLPEITQKRHCVRS